MRLFSFPVLMSKSSFTIEVVATSIDSCIAALKGGAKRIELCAALSTAGVTPSAGLTAAVRDLGDFELVVMIRPREGDFVYSNRELDVMKREMDMFRSLNVQGFVFGVLDEENRVDIQSLNHLVKHAGDIPVIFHRAFDCTPDLSNALEAIVEAGCIRILTSGGKKNGSEGGAIIHHLVEQAKGRINIMPGGGLTLDNIASVYHPQIVDYHLSGRSWVASKTQTDLFDMSRAETQEELISKVVEQTRLFFNDYSN